MYRVTAMVKNLLLATALVCAASSVWSAEPAAEPASAKEVKPASDASSARSQAHEAKTSPAKPAHTQSQKAAQPAETDSSSSPQPQHSQAVMHSSPLMQTAEE